MMRLAVERDPLLDEFSEQPDRGEQGNARQGFEKPFWEGG